MTCHQNMLAAYSRVVAWLPMSWAMHQEAFSEISYTTDYGRHPFDLKLICWSRWVHFISYAHALLIDSSPSHLHVAASSYYSCQHGAKPFRTAENELLALDPEYSERNTPTASIIDSTILPTKLCHHVGPCMRDAFIPSFYTVHSDHSSARSTRKLGHGITFYLFSGLRPKPRSREL